MKIFFLLYIFHVLKVQIKTEDKLISLPINKITDQGVATSFKDSDFDIISFYANDMDSKNILLNITISTVTADITIPFATIVQYSLSKDELISADILKNNIRVLYVATINETEKFIFGCPKKVGSLEECDFYIGLNRQYVETIKKSLISTTEDYGYVSIKSGNDLIFIHYMVYNSEACLYIISLYPTVSSTKRTLSGYQKVKCLNVNSENAICLLYKLLYGQKTFVYQIFNKTSLSDSIPNLSSSFMLMNNLFDFFVTKDEYIISCFVINTYEDRMSVNQLNCYKNTLQELREKAVIKYTMFAKANIRTKGVPAFFIFLEQMKIIDADDNGVEVFFYDTDQTTYLTIDTYTKDAYLNEDEKSYIYLAVSNTKNSIYMIKDKYISTKDKEQTLTLKLTILENVYTSFLEYQILPENITAFFSYEGTSNGMGEASLFNESSGFKMINYSETNGHFIQLFEKGVYTGNYTYSLVPFVFYYKFNIYPQYCKTYTEDAQKCITCVDGSTYVKEDSLCHINTDFTPGKYYDDIAGELLDCDEYCIKCHMLKVGGVSGCTICNETKYLYRFSCFDSCPEDTFTYSFTEKVVTEQGTLTYVSNVCADECPEGYSGYITQITSESVLEKRCISNDYNKTKESRQSLIDEFKNSDTNTKKTIFNEIYNKYSQITTVTDQNLNEWLNYFLLLNLYMSSYDSDDSSKNEVISTYNSAISTFRSRIYHISSDDNEIYVLNRFLCFSVVLDNIGLLDASTFTLFINLISQYSAITSLKFTVDEIEKINLIMSMYEKYVSKIYDIYPVYYNSKLDENLVKNDSYYRLTKIINKNTYTSKMQDFINNSFSFLSKFKLYLFCYKTNTYSIYIKKISDQENDQEYSLKQLGIELQIIGSKSDKVTSRFTTNQIAENLKKENLNIKIIIPSLQTLNKSVTWENCNFAYATFSKAFPLLHHNLTSYVSKEFYTINFYDSSNEKIAIEGLKDDNPIKVIKEKPENDMHMSFCIYYDSVKVKIDDKGTESYDLSDYIVCTANHLTDFSIATFSPTTVEQIYESTKEVSIEERIAKSYFPHKDVVNGYFDSNSKKIFYINAVIVILDILLLLLKSFFEPKLSMTEDWIDDPFFRYTTNDSVETDKKVLKYIIEKEINYILKFDKNYVNQKKQEEFLDSKTNAFGKEKNIVTIVEDDSDNDADDNPQTERKQKLVSFQDNNLDINNDIKNKKRINNLKSNKKNDINIEMCEYGKNNFDYNENIKRAKIDTVCSTKSGITNISENSILNNSNNEINKDEINDKKKVKTKKTSRQRLEKWIKEQKRRQVFSLITNHFTEFQESFNSRGYIDNISSFMKKPSSLIGISRILNKKSKGKEDEKLLIKNEFFVTLKMVLYLLYQYEYRPISLFNRITLPITRINLITLFCFRLNLELTMCIFLSQRYVSVESISTLRTIATLLLIIIITDLIYSILEIMLTKKKISTTTDTLERGVIIFKQIMLAFFAYAIIIALFLYGNYYSIWISMYLNKYEIKCNYLYTFIFILFFDYLVYENIIILIKGLIFTYVIYLNTTGCMINVMKVLKYTFIFYLAE